MFDPHFTTIAAIFSFFSQNTALIIGLLTAVVSLIKATRWGQAHAKALELVMTVIEKSGNEKIKKTVEIESNFSEASVKLVLDNVSQTVDPSKPTPSKLALFENIATKQIL